MRLALYHRMALFAVCAPGLEPVLEGEVRSLGLAGRAVSGGVEVDDDGALPRLNLWLRTASRVLLRLGQVEATAFPELVRKASALPWERYVAGPVAFRVTCRKSRLYHSDAVAERLHAALEARLKTKVPLADDESAQLFVARFDRDVCTISADSSGALLHQRGYRLDQGPAPLRETLAAALLLAAGYSGSGPLCDPLCGSGTIAIEGALLAADRAPGLERGFAFEKWPGSWRMQELREQARGRIRAISAPIEASDQDAEAVAAARQNAARAGAEIAVVQRPLAALPAAQGAGILACNPPYGVRLGGDIRALYRELGEAARRRPGWQVAAVVAQDAPAAVAGLPWRRVLRTQNGGITVEFMVEAEATMRTGSRTFKR
jgi:putative N6-adenine-specific DNA methylase